MSKAKRVTKKPDAALCLRRPQEELHNRLEYCRKMLFYNNVLTEAENDAVFARIMKRIPRSTS